MLFIGTKIPTTKHFAKFTRLTYLIKKRVFQTIEDRYRDATRPRKRPVITAAL